MSNNNPLLIPQKLIPDLLNSETSQYLETEYSISTLDQDISIKDLVLLALLVYVLFKFIKRNLIEGCSSCDL